MPDAPPRSSPSPAGRVVRRRAIEEIVRTAVLGSYGVTGLSAPSLLGASAACWGRPSPGSGSAWHRSVSVDIWLTVAYGVPVAEVARQVDSAIRYSLRRALGREVGRGRRSTSTASRPARTRQPARRRGAPGRPTPARAATSRRTGRRRWSRLACDGAGFLGAVRAAVANLDAHVDEVNALNVFPVPDGDTGSNMMRHLPRDAGRADRVAQEPADRVVAAALLRGA